MPFVVPDVCRFAVHQTLDGRQVVNVLDMEIDTTGSTMSRTEAIENQAESIITEWAATILQWQVNELQLTSVSYVDLNTSDGVTGERTSSDTVTLPATGVITFDPFPSNVAGLVTKTVSSARGRRNGRMYLAGLSENRTDATSVNTMSSAVINGINTSLAAFKSGVEELDTVGTAFESHLVVTHVLTRGTSTTPGRPGPPLTGGYNRVESLTIEGRLATQRRRLRG